jgi:hypothetical protein
MHQTRDSPVRGEVAALLRPADVFAPARRVYLQPGGQQCCCLIACSWLYYQ